MAVLRANNAAYCVSDTILRPCSQKNMLYKCTVLALLAATDAFQAGSLSSHSVASSVTRAAKVAMQVAEAEVASPVALAKVRASPVCQGGTAAQPHRATWCWWR